MDDSIKVSTSKNEAYGKFEETAFTNDVLPSRDLPTSQNVAYGDIPTSNTQSFSSRVTGSLDATSIPTTRNEAYTSVSTNTERVDTEETYDYVRNL